MTVQILYNTWPSSGTTVDNQGSAGSNADGGETANHYVSVPPYSAQKITASNESVIGGSDASVDTLGGFTFDYLFKYDSSTVATAYFFAKGPHFYISYTKATGILTLYRASTGIGTDYVQWSCNIGVLVNNSWYELQISWGGPSSTPVIKINNVAKTPSQNHASGFLIFSWADDSSYSVKIMNGDSQTAALRCTLAVFRLNDSTTLSGAMTTNYTADWGRVYQMASWSQTTVPTVTTHAYAPSCVAVNQTPVWIERKSPNVATAALPPSATIVTNELPVAGNVTIAAHAPTCTVARYPDVPAPPNIDLTWTVRDNFVFTTVVEETQK